MESMADILFIDDDESIRFLMQEELGLEGHTVRVAPDGPSGIRAADEITPDAVILDVKMPGMGGLEVLRHLKSTCPQVPVFLFTAFSDYRDQAEALGADGYFVKSPDLSEVKAVLRQIAAARGSPPFTVPFRSG